VREPTHFAGDLQPGDQCGFSDEKGGRAAGRPP